MATLAPAPPDVEAARKKARLLPGFPETSWFIARDPAKNAVVFRRFDQLAVRNLLHLEARLVALEQLQNTLDRDDIDFNTNNEPITTAARSWEDFAVFGNVQKDDSGDIPRSVLNRWRAKRGKEAEDYRAKALMKRQKIVAWRGTQELLNSSYEAEALAQREPRNLTWNLNVRAAAEGKDFHNNSLGCGPTTLSLLRERWELATAIESSLKEYQEAVLRYREMLKLEVPAERTKTVGSDWIGGRRPDGTQGEVQFLPNTPMNSVYANERSLSSPDTLFRRAIRSVRQSWGLDPREPADDLLGIGRIAGVDLLTRFIAPRKFLTIFRDRHFAYPQLTCVPESVIHTTVTLLTICIAVIMVIGGIWGLYYLRIEQNSFAADLGLLSGLIILFGVLMKVVTTASRTELFGATAGYAAVLVVFVAFQAPQNSALKFNFNGANGNGTISG